MRPVRRLMEPRCDLSTVAVGAALDDLFRQGVVNPNSPSILAIEDLAAADGVKLPQ